jgi:hypothetical protein
MDLNGWMKRLDETNGPKTLVVDGWKLGCNPTFWRFLHSKSRKLEIQTWLQEFY